MRRLLTRAHRASLIQLSLARHSFLHNHNYNHNYNCYNLSNRLTSSSISNMTTPSSASSSASSCSSSPSSSYFYNNNNQDWRRGSVRNTQGEFLMPWLGESPSLSSDFKTRPPLSSLFHWVLTRNSPVPAPHLFPIQTPHFLTDSLPLPQSALSLSESESKSVIESESESESRCTWIGHATCLLQLKLQQDKLPQHGEENRETQTQAVTINILTDAVFSERCSPVQWMGPARYVPPACTIAALPKVHIVLISHDHYDHLDWQSIMDLEKHHQPIYVCGLELGKWFRDVAGVEQSRVIELDWWQSIKLFDEKVNIEFVPVQHWSKRHAYGDERKSLWGGFSVSTSNFRFFFNGDTGYNAELYEEIGKRCGPFDLCAIPIGAYEPRTIMKIQHVDPNEAFLIHKHLNSAVSFGIHHGTFILTDEPVDEPRSRIHSISKANSDVPPFVAINHGASITFEGKCFKINSA